MVLPILSLDSVDASLTFAPYIDLVLMLLQPLIIYHLHHAGEVLTASDKTGPEKEKAYLKNNDVRH